MTNISDEVIHELIKRMTGESDMAYQAFCRYALLPESERSIAKALPVIARNMELAEATLKSYSSQFKWNERVGSIISYLLMLNIKEQHEINKELNQEFLETNRNIKRETMVNLQKASQFLSKHMNWALLAGEEKITGYVTDKDNNRVPVTTEIKMPIKPTDFVQIVNAMQKMVSLVNDIPTEIVNNKPISNRNVEDIEDMAELDKLEAELKRQLEGGEEITESIN